MKTSSQASSGFTLVELVVSLAIFAILVVVAIPSYNVWIQREHIRGVAESLRDGVQRARAEAVARNGSVQFVLGGDYFWAVNAGGEVIESRGTGEIPDSVTLTMTPDAAMTVTFGGVGTPVDNADGTESITEVEVVSTALPEDIGKFRVIVRSGGAKVCNPNVSDSEDVRFCG